MSCPDCFRGSVHTHAEATGTITTVHGVCTYVAGGSDPSRSKSTIIYVPDAFSLKLTNNLILADKYASATGCRVLIPDLVHNGGMDPWVLPLMEGVMAPLPSFPWSIGSALGKFFTVLRLLPQAVPFMLFGKPQKVYHKILAYARAARAELPEGGRLGVAGFCWGAWGGTKLCVETAVEGGSERLIDAQFNAHPSYMVETPEMIVDAITKLKVPYSSAVAELDFQFNKAVAEKTEAKVREAAGGSKGDGEGGYHYEFVIYKGAKHGFGVRSQEDEPGMEAYEKAVAQATGWFNKYLN